MFCVIFEVPLVQNGPQHRQTAENGVKDIVGDTV